MVPPAVTRDAGEVEKHQQAAHRVRQQAHRVHQQSHRVHQQAHRVHQQAHRVRRHVHDDVTVMCTCVCVCVMRCDVRPVVSGRHICQLESSVITDHNQQRQFSNTSTHTIYLVLTNWQQQQSEVFYLVLIYYYDNH